MENLYINGKKIDSFGDWSPQTEHPAIAIQRKEHDERIALEQELKMTPKQITFVSPEPQEMPDVCKGESLLELEKKYYPLLKEQRIKLDDAYSKVTLMQSAIEPSEFEIQDELSQKPFVYYQYEDNDGFGIYPENIPAAISSLPAGHRIVKMVKASRGAGQFIYMTNKSDEELREIARQNILASRNKQLENVKLCLLRELQAMKDLISAYETQKKIAMQADIEQLVKISTKYAKVL
ncbi:MULTISPECIES: transposase [Salmonella]|uniref:Transposase n=2 Tax=Salmonella TaxID=590 RepID=A0A624AQ71_SALEN|nr:MULTISPECIES: transposase [Salmonella]HDW6424187.1 transposase [Salmonella enterica subsp. enterica serovar Typhi]ECI2920365.1 transposase [Salmonella enterica subsp. enterica serovar Enteritidis]ECZ5195154.1 transposase [Salmonella enterica subsp. enterica serovar Enteritidis]EDM8340722.1 transposase [Salmonella enterica subsp. enterica serovar Enteritidis]EDT1755277.1 transposase [Salmonella enterica subsp. enterica serovar Enteritidis]